MTNTPQPSALDQLTEAINARIIPQFHGEINLEDVLRWVGMLAFSKHFIVLPSGNIYMFVSGYLDEQKATWKLNRNLSEQSPETISFLHSLLK